MKSKDITVLVMIGIASAILAIVLSNVVISGEKNRSETVEVVPVIYTDFTELPKEYFNENTINPTFTIQIDQQDNQKPFGISE